MSPTHAFRRLLIVVPGDPDAATAEPPAWTESLSSALKPLERYVVGIAAGHNGFTERLRATVPDLILNACPLAAQPPCWSAAALAGIAAIRETPISGPAAAQLALLGDRQAVRLIARDLGVEVPRQAFIRGETPVLPLPDFYPAVMKLNRAERDVAAEEPSVLAAAEAGRRALAALVARYPEEDLLWQEYLPGTEILLCLFGNGEDLTVLPPLIQAAEADEAAESAAALPSGLQARLENWARMLFRRFRLKDAALFRFRASADGRPKLLEVDPVPSLRPDAPLAQAAAKGGQDYPAMLASLIDTVEARHGG